MHDEKAVLIYYVVDVHLQPKQLIRGHSTHLCKPIKLHVLTGNDLMQCT